MALSAISCSKVPVPVPESEDTFAGLITGIFTRGTGNGNVYRVYLNGIDGTTTMGKEYSGTYADLTSGGQFTPCRVNSNGEFASADETGESGLRATDGAYKMHIVYPAIAMTPIEGEEGLNGYLIYRQGAESPLYLSNARNVNVSGVYIKEENSQGQYIYDATSLELKQQRSKITIIFKCGTEIESTTLHKIIFRNIIDNGYFRPADGRFYYRDEDVHSDDIYIAPAGGLTLGTGETAKVVADQYILSMDYGEKDNQGNAKWPLPSFEIHIGSDASTTIDFTAALGWNFEPQNNYEFTITISSLYVQVDVYATEWRDNGTTGVTIGNPKRFTVQFPLEDGSDNILEWDQVHGGTGTLG